MTGFVPDLAAAVPAPADLGRVHLIAIGGAGMSAVARLLLAAGLTVSGSDAKDSPTLSALAAAGARVFVGHSADRLDGVDTVVVSSAIRTDNPELVAARERGLRILHRSQALASLGSGRHVVAVAGANGKSTTTSMIVAALVAAGRDPSFASGAEIPQLGTNAAIGTGPDLVVEADESDGSFVVYAPDVAIVTNVQADHLDYYGDLAGVERAYRRFVDSAPDGGLLVVCADDRGSRELGEYARGTSRRVRTYGAREDADVRLTSADPTDVGGRAELSVGARRHELVLQVPGRHNLENAAGAFTVLTEACGLTPEAALGGLASFSGAARRFESHGEPFGVRVIDDYAHNAPKVTAAVRTGREMADRRGGRLLVIFQPHLYSRTRDFAQEFAAALEPADEIVLLAVYPAREDPIEGVSSNLISDRMSERGPGRSVVVEPDFEAAVQHVAAVARPGDVVMTIGAGDVTSLAPRLADALAHRAGEAGEAS
ncbi:UDP-N-acetylmuramate--L-alanine ligase [Nostocoides sp. F2B08]|uniref:UDP-N-acetylmuramate--L-alanine ligase n=1 Tax=Nostocoides sp. F2B08 TaxID=2653936 RepID=UPI0012636133|nr:UDP-N-acetylmuramate--L-alanine ligase [Tetrasphaera sp. F2B08]KAB7741056.1 UDP-N-acetylmuramate--L-alanine ligase [Tetrasphaera sp. F2B08]